MELKNINTSPIDWDNINPVETKGETGINISREINLDNIRLRISEYSVNYKSAEWCNKGHIIHCIEGEMTIHLKSGNSIKLAAGYSLVLGENDSHIGVTGNSSAKIFIVD